jgi:hypothetical protein
VSPDDFDSLPPDDSFQAEDVDPTLDDGGPAEGEDTIGSTADHHGGEGSDELESLFGAGGALELASDPAGDQELARWLDGPAPPGPPEELTDFADRLARRLRDA